MGVVGNSRSWRVPGLRTLWKQFHKYGPVVRLLLENLNCANQEERNIRIDSYDSNFCGHFVSPSP